MAVLKVKAVAGGEIRYAGYYDHIRRKPGDIFILKKESDFSHRWMEAIGWKPADKTETQKVADKEIIRSNGAKPIGAVQTGKQRAMSGDAVAMSQLGRVAPQPVKQAAPEIEPDPEPREQEPGFDDTTPNPPDEAI